MLSPVRFPLRFYRTADFIQEFYPTESGNWVDLTGFSGRFSLKRYDGDPGSALISVANTTSYAAGVNCAIGNGFRLWVADSAIAGLPDPGVRGDPAIFEYNLYLTGPSGPEFVAMFGPVYVYGGV